MNKELKRRLETFLNYCIKNNVNAMFILSSEDVTVGSMTNPNPSYWIPTILGMFMDISSRVKSGDLDKMEIGPLMQFILINTVLNYLDKEKYAEKFNKYNQFKSGKLDNLTDKEIDEFIDYEVNKNKSTSKFELEVNLDGRDLTISQVSDKSAKNRSLLITLCNLFSDYEDIRVDAVNQVMYIKLKEDNQLALEEIKAEIKNFITGVLSN